MTGRLRSVPCPPSTELVHGSVRENQDRQFRQGVRLTVDAHAFASRERHQGFQKVGPEGTGQRGPCGHICDFGPRRNGRKENTGPGSGSTAGRAQGAGRLQLCGIVVGSGPGSGKTRARQQGADPHFDRSSARCRRIGAQAPAVTIAGKSPHRVGLRLQGRGRQAPAPGTLVPRVQNVFFSVHVRTIKRSRMTVTGRREINRGKLSKNGNRHAKGTGSRACRPVFRHADERPLGRPDRLGKRRKGAPSNGTLDLSS